MACPVAILDGTFCSGWTCVVGTLHFVVAHADTVLLTVLIRVEAVMDFMVNIIVSAATLRIWYTFATAVEKPRFAEAALFAFHC